MRGNMQIMELFTIAIAILGVGGSVVSFVWNLHHETDRRIDKVENTLIEVLTKLEQHMKDSQEFARQVQEWREVDRELMNSKLELHWVALENIKQMVGGKKVMIEFTVTIGGQQYPLKATDRKLFSLLSSFDDRVRLLISAPPDAATIEAQFRQIFTIGALLDDAKLAAIDRWLADQNVPPLLLSR